MKKQFVKKLVSLSPDRYELIDINIAIKNYSLWLKNVEPIDFKDFNEWLLTEI